LPPSLSVLFRTALTTAAGVFFAFSSLAFALAFVVGVAFGLAAAFGVSFFLAGSSFSSELLSELEELRKQHAKNESWNL
jgi:hypothetical protein